MIQSWAVQKKAEAHRRDLARFAQVRKPSGHARREATWAEPVMATGRSATVRPVAGGRAARRPVGSRIGAWLIQAGTRLGGASLRAN